MTFKKNSDNEYFFIHFFIVIIVHCLFLIFLSRCARMQASFGFCFVFFWDTRIRTYNSIDRYKHR